MASTEPKPICERIGERVHARRHALKLSLTDLGDRTGLSRSYLCELEHGRCEPGAGTIVRLCRALNVSADWLLGCEEV